MYYLKFEYRNGVKGEISLDREEFYRIQDLHNKKIKIEKVKGLDGKIRKIDYRNIINIALSVDSKNIPNGLRPGSNLP